MTATATPVPDSRQLERYAFRMLVGDELVAGGDERRVEDPSTGETLLAVPEASPADVDRAVEVAKAAQPAWERLGVEGRSALFWKLADAIEARADELAYIDAVDSGNPLSAMRFDVEYSLMNLRQWPSMVRWHAGRIIPATPHGLHYTRFMPYGVVGRIVPFNHPLMFAITRILPALLAGNSVVLKPSENTPLGALALGELVRDVFPPGVLNIIAGGQAAGDALVAHPDIKRIAFTGSVHVGQKIQRRAAEVAVKHVSLELGGKNAMIICPDIDVERAATTALEGMNMTTCQGQSCGSNSRTFVHESLYDDFLERLGESVSALHVGPAYVEGTEMGPVVSAAHRERVSGYIDSAKQEGARLVTGGGRPAGLPDGGHYLEPTVFADVEPEMRIAREEIFGPVMSIFRWRDLDEVIEKANDTELGLTAGVHTHDLDLAHRVADRLDAGYVWINDSAKHFFGTPFGGTKSSGTGREESIEEYESYLETKVIHTMLGDERAGLRRITS